MKRRKVEMGKGYKEESMDWKKRKTSKNMKGEMTSVSESLLYSMHFSGV